MPHATRHFPQPCSAHHNIDAIILLTISKEPNGKLGLNLEFLDLLLEFLTGKWQLGRKLVLTPQLLVLSPSLPSLGELAGASLGTCGIKSHPADSTWVCTSVYNSSLTGVA